MGARWVGRILRLAPRSFRERHMEDFVATSESRRRAAGGGWRGALFALREMVGTLWLVLRLRLGPSGRLSEARRFHALSTVWQDVRFSVRALRRSPGFATVAMAVLALGIGANAAIFTATNAYFFRPLPFADADRLVTVYETNPEFGWVDETAAPANLLDWREQVGAFTDVSGYVESTDHLTAFRDGEPVIVTGTEVLGNFFSTLAVQPELGRTFRMEETWSGASDVVVLSHDLWVRHYGADPDVIGGRLELATRSPEVIGVMPAGFTFPSSDVEMWYPMDWDRSAVAEVWFRRAHFVRAFARVADGVALDEADAQLQVVVHRLQVEHPATNSVMGAGLMPMRSFLVGDARTPLLVLLGAVLLLLLLACTNVANLMLVRAGERGRELALRRALGAGRARLVRQLLTESAILAAAGGAAGLLLGWIAVRAVAASAPVGIAGATSVSLDYRVVLFTCGAAVASALLFGTAPALRVSARADREDLIGAPRGATSAAGSRGSDLLVSLEVALALLLVVGAGLMMRTFASLSRVDPGFRADGVLAVQFAVPSTDYPNRDQVLDFYERFENALEARPGIERAGIVQALPLTGTNWSSQFQADGWPADRVGFEILHRPADAGYFEALKIALIEGRMLGPDDGPGATPVVLVNESFALAHFPGEDPVGRRIAFDRNAGPDSRWHEIVGIVADQLQEGLSRPARPEVFESARQEWSRNNWTVIRVDGEPMEYLPAVRAVLTEFDPRIPIATARTLRSVRSDSMATEELVLGLLGGFGVAALLLAVLGVYGVTSVAARRRTREIGIRMALGARSGDVLSMTLRRGLAVVAIGLLLGVLAALGATRALSSLLYGVEPTDPGTYVAVVALLGFVALVACYLPARRASAVDPVVSLRME